MSKHFHNIHRLKLAKNVITTSVQSAQVEACQLIHSALLECNSSVKQMLLQLWYNEVTLNSYCNANY